MSITETEKELIAVGVSVAAGCRPCTVYHVKAARTAGASDDEIEHAVADALAVREDATRIMDGYALGQLGGLTVDNEPTPIDASQRAEILVSIGAALGVNCTASLKQYLAAAAELRLPQEDVKEIAKLAAVLRQKAASHVERLAGMTKEAAA